MVEPKTPVKLVVSDAKYQSLFHKKRFEISIRKHAIVDEKSPFVLYGLEVKSEYSRFAILKQFQNFIKLQQELVIHKDEKVEIRKQDGSSEIWPLERLIPKLPSSFMSLVWSRLPSNSDIEKKKSALEKYCQALLDLVTWGVRTEINDILEGDDLNITPDKKSSISPFKSPNTRNYSVLTAIAELEQHH